MARAVSSTLRTNAIIMTTNLVNISASPFQYLLLRQHRNRLRPMRGAGSDELKKNFKPGSSQRVCRNTGSPAAVQV
jgi:hypothetical protein